MEWKQYVTEQYRNMLACMIGVRKNKFTFENQEKKGTERKKKTEDFCVLVEMMMTWTNIDAL